MKNVTLLALFLLLTSTTLFAQTPGDALLFGPDNDNIVKAAGVGTSNTDNITLEAWVKWNGNAGRNQIIAYNGLDGTDGYGIILDNDTDGNKLSLIINVIPPINSNSTLPVGSWAHVALVRNSGNWTLYLNGNATSLSSSLAPITPSTYFKVGNNTSLWYGFNGTIDEVRLSSSARYTGNFTPLNVPLTNDGNTIILYHFDEGTGQTANDASSFNNDGQLGSTSTTDTSDPTWVTSDAPLPVLLYSFSAKLVHNKVELEWQTSPLTEMEIFEIQRFDGKSWQKAGLIKAHPQSGGFQDFSWVDNMSFFSKDLTEIGYRIKYNDLAGNTAYSETQTVNVTNPTSMWLAQNHPNPFNPGTTISYAITEPSNVKLIVYNNLGEQVQTLVNEYQYENFYSVTFDASRLPSGLYFYKLMVNNSYIDMKKMLVMK